MPLSRFLRIRACGGARGSHTHFLAIANLAADVDFIEEIVWSPDKPKSSCSCPLLPHGDRISELANGEDLLGKEWVRSASGEPPSAAPKRCGRSSAVEFPGTGPVRLQIDVRMSGTRSG